MLTIARSAAIHQLVQMLNELHDAMHLSTSQRCMASCNSYAQCEIEPYPYVFYPCFLNTMQFLLVFIPFTAVFLMIIVVFTVCRNARIASTVLATAIPSVRLSHSGIVSKRRHVARYSLHCQI